MILIINGRVRRPIKVSHTREYTAFPNVVFTECWFGTGKPTDRSVTVANTIDCIAGVHKAAYNISKDICSWSTDRAGQGDVSTNPVGVEDKEQW